MNKKLLVLATVLSVGALVGCGKKESTTPTSEATSVVATTSNVTSAGGESTSAATSEAAPITNAIGSASEPATVANTIVEGLKIIESNYDDGTFISTVDSYVSGVVVSIVESTKVENGYNVELRDVNDSTKVITLFGLVKEAGVGDIHVGDVLTAKGKLENWRGTVEVINGSLTAVASASYNITTSIEHGSITGLEATGMSGSEVTFTVTPDASYKIENVKLNDKVITANEAGEYKFVVTDVNNVVVSIIDASAVAKVQTTISMLDAAIASGNTETGKPVESLATGDENITVVGTKTGNNTKMYGTINANGEWTAANWRFYATDSGNFTITCKYTIETLKIVFKKDNETSSKLMNGDVEVVSDVEFEVNQKSITLTAAGTKNIQVSEIVVTYTPVEEVVE